LFWHSHDFMCCVLQTSKCWCLFKVIQIQCLQILTSHSHLKLKAFLSTTFLQEPWLGLPKISPWLNPLINSQFSFHLTTLPALDADGLYHSWKIFLHLTFGIYSPCLTDHTSTFFARPSFPDWSLFSGYWEVSSVWELYYPFRYGDPQLHLSRHLSGL
jgi:hypothetical protein